MSKILSYTFFALAALASLSSCEKNNLVQGKEIIPPSFVKIGTWNNNDSVGTYYIKSNTEAFKIPIAVTSASDKDRTIQLTYTSTSAEPGVQFNGPASLVIPAGKVLDSISIQGILAGYSTPGRIDKLTITISGGDVPLMGVKTSYILTLRKYCAVVESELTGDYTNTTDGGSTQGIYTAKVVNWVSAGPTSATANIINLGATSDAGWGGPYFATSPVSDPGIKVKFDWADPANFKVTVASQPYFDDGSGISLISATAGTFSSCDQIIVLPTTTKYAGNGKSYLTTTTLKR